MLLSRGMVSAPFPGPNFNYPFTGARVDDPDYSLNDSLINKKMLTEAPAGRMQKSLS